ncbi:DUF5667 domain-containing protein [Nocardioides ferulae]|uniref:DUF5667 domain-containing protein n=1 Tax=Nocardioides ferulae TaxID=2340821 RepID=UPI000EB3B718|nr:DUF5667 domain-containing protein [Nocardioides ferulae]
MISRFPAQRRAEAFDAALEHGSASAQDAQLLELVTALRATPQPTARPEFVTSLRERLMAEAATALATAPESGSSADNRLEARLTVAPRRTARDRRLAVAAAGLAMVGATGSVAVASQSALPGDALYPVKRAIENAEAGFSVNEHQKGATLLANARGRLAEADALASRDDADQADEIAATLDTFTAQATEASDLLVDDYETNANAGAIAELRDFTATSMDQLTALEASVPETARGALVTAAQALTRIDAEAQNLCSVCGGQGISVIPPQFVTVSVESLLSDLATELTTTDDEPTDPAAASDKGGKPGKAGKGDGRPGLPQIELGEDQPGSVSNPDTGQPTPGLPGTAPLGGAGGTGDDGSGTTGSGGGKGGAPEVSIPVVSPVLEGVGALLEELTGALLGTGDSPTEP